MGRRNNAGSSLQQSQSSLTELTDFGSLILTVTQGVAYTAGAGWGPVYYL